MEEERSVVDEPAVLEDLVRGSSCNVRIRSASLMSMGGGLAGPCFGEVVFAEYSEVGMLLEVFTSAMLCILG